MRQLQQVFPGDVYPVVDAMTKPPVGDLPANTIRITPDFCASAGLRVFRSVGWRCGDYAFYAARKALPQYDRFWMIEPDVVITFPTLGDFFDLFADRGDDYIAPNFSKRQPWWMWHKFMAPEVGADAVYGTLYPISRISAPAIDWLAPVRAAMMAAMPPEAGDAAIPNDESFTASILQRDGFSCVDARSITPETTFAPATFGSGVLVMPDEVAHPSLANKVLHSVRSAELAKGGLKNIRKNAPATYEKLRQRVIANVGEAAWEGWIQPSLT